MSLPNRATDTIDDDTVVLPDEPIEPDYRLLDIDPLDLVSSVVFLPGDVTLLSQTMRVREEYARVTRGLDLPWELAIHVLDQIRHRRGLDRPAPCRCGCHDTSAIPVRLTPVSYWLCCHDYGLSEIIQVIRHIERHGTARLCPWLEGEDVDYIEVILSQTPKG